MPNPLFSIVVPSRDRVDWLTRCLKGISEQSYDDYEVLIIDDGSLPGVLDSYRSMLAKFGERYRLIEASKAGSRRLGPSLARNLGISRARGDFIAFCDDDDYWCQRDLLETAALALHEVSADLYFSDQLIMCDQKVVSPGSFKNVSASLRPEQKLSCLPVYQVTKGQMLIFPDYAHLNITIASSALLKKIGGFWEETRYAEDVDIFVRLCSSAEEILFRPDVCAVHNAPIKHDKESASKSVAELDRRLLENAVYWHLLVNCKTPEAVRYASLSLASNSKLLARDMKAERKGQVALIISRIAFAVKPRVKWGLYVVVLQVKALFGKLIN